MAKGKKRKAYDKINAVFLDVAQDVIKHLICKFVLLNKRKVIAYGGSLAEITTLPHNLDNAVTFICETKKKRIVLFIPVVSSRAISTDKEAIKRIIYNNV